jgi:hypothetical protein
MPSEVKLEKLIVQIIRQTTEGDLEWEATSPPRSLVTGTEDVIHDYFETVYKNQLIAVFERKFRSYDPDHDATYWTSRDCFAFLREDRSISWETSDLPSRLFALLNAARESAADVDGIVDSLLE